MPTIVRDRERAPVAVDLNKVMREEAKVADNTFVLTVDRRLRRAPPGVDGPQILALSRVPGTTGRQRKRGRVRE